MNLPGPGQPRHEKQGELGDLSLKTKPELLDLLARQQQLLANSRFLSRLPDKGAKVKNFASSLKKLIEEREEVDGTAKLFERMDIGQQDSTVGAITERNYFEKDSECSLTGSTTKTAGLSEEKLSPAAKMKETKGKFRPHRDLRSVAIPTELATSEHKGSSPVRTGQRLGAERLKVVLDETELSSAREMPLRNQEAQVVEFEVSADLLQHQKKQVEALIAQQASERLAERLGIVMGDFIPDIQGSYRNPAAGSESEMGDSDEEGEEDDDEGAEQGEESPD